MQIDAFLKKNPKLHVNERICASISEFEFSLLQIHIHFKWLQMTNERDRKT